MLRSSLRRPRAAGQFVTLQEMEDYSTLFLDGEFYVGEDAPCVSAAWSPRANAFIVLPSGVLKDTEVA